MQSQSPNQAISQTPSQSPNQTSWFDYDAPVPNSPTSSCSIKQAWAKVPTELDPIAKDDYKHKIKQLLQQKNAVLVAHYYVDSDIQDLAWQTGGLVGDSLEMARFGARHPAKTLVVAGVRFMGESAKILSPEKTILMPDLNAECSLDLGCPIDEFSVFCDAHPDRTVVVYANTSAAVKARADWVVTSSVALEIVSHLRDKGEKIIWGPDRHLGDYIRRETGADMLLWQGSCIVHNEFKALELEQLKQEHPDAIVLVHPESPAGVVALGDVVGSTSKLLKAAIQRPEKTFIVATDLGILHEMKKHAPQKTFIAAPTAGNSATCKSCAFCPWMAMNGIQGVYNALANHTGEVVMDKHLIKEAYRSLDRMLGFADTLNKTAKPKHGMGVA